MMSRESIALFTATQRGVLKDMRNTSGIRRIRLEADTEDIVLIISGDMKIVCIRFIVGQLHCCQVQLRNMLLFTDGEAVKLFPDAGEILQVGDS